MQTPQLSLYQFDACPYCQKVRRALASLPIKVEIRDTRQGPQASQSRDELLAQGGKTQVPCLKIEMPDAPVRWMYESGDIIDYLESLSS